jgi:hypothetical protein
MRFTVSALSAMLLLSVLVPAAAQQKKQKGPEPLWTETELKGFLIQGGVVNTVEGDVTGGIGDEAPRPLPPKLELQKGHVVRVGRGGRSEILLAPGSYLRLSGDTRVAFADLSRESYKFKILYGSAILEVSEIPDPALAFGPSISEQLLAGIYPPITVATPQGEFVTLKGGVYRFDVSAGGAADLKVFKGEAVVARQRLKGGTAATLRDGAAAVTKFDEETGDAFDGWSRERAAALVKSNKSLRDTHWSRFLRKHRRSYFRIEDESRAGLAREQLTVSAIGGLVNYAEDAAVSVDQEAAWERLSEGVGLSDGDRVRTGAEGRVELLLYPNCYLHLSGNTEIAYRARPDGGTTVELRSGSAIVTSEFDKRDRALVTLAAPRAAYELVREGIYRLNVPGGGESELIVYEGRARVAGSEVKAGRRVVSQETGQTVSPISKKALDSFDVWSRKRAASVAASDDGVRYFLALLKRERTAYGGLWYFNEAAGEYTFVPGYWNFRSPYGGQYSVKFRAQR